MLGAELTSGFWLILTYSSLFCISISATFFQHNLTVQTSDPRLSRPMHPPILPVHLPAWLSSAAQVLLDHKHFEVSSTLAASPSIQPLPPDPSQGFWAWSSFLVLLLRLRPPSMPGMPWLWWFPNTYRRPTHALRHGTQLLGPAYFCSLAFRIPPPLLNMPAIYLSLK